MTIEEAIRIANDVLLGGEGVDLFYYMDERYGPEYGEAIKVLRAVLETQPA